MWKIALVAVLALGLLGIAVADEETPQKELKRGFEDGKFTDEYFGITYVAEGLKEGFSFGATRALWSGKCAGGVDIDIACEELPKEMKGIEWRDLVEKSMTKDSDSRTDVTKGDTPVPWMLFVQESVAGFQRQHGYAFYPRGHQCFVVHAKVREKTETSAEAIQKALAGLKVDPNSESLLYVHLIAKNQRSSLTDPVILLGAGVEYMRGTHPNSVLSLRALLQAREGAEGFDDDQRWQLHQSIGLNLLLLGRHEEAVGTWKKVVELAAKTSEAASLTANSQYNLACAYSLLGRLDEAFEALRACFEKGPADMILELKQHAAEDGDLENMRKDERWKGLIEGEKPQDEAPEPE